MTDINFVIYACPVCGETAKVQTVTTYAQTLRHIHIDPKTRHTFVIDFVKLTPERSNNDTLQIET